MSPADIVKFEAQALKDGRPIKVYVEHEDTQPISRETAFHMILGASLLLEECERHAGGRLERRIQLLRERMESAIARENHAQAVVASKPALPTVEDFTE